MVTITTVSSKDADAKRLITKWATAEDFTQVKSRHNEAKRHDFLVARSAMRALLAHATGISDWHIRSDPNGKPYAITVTGKAGPHISLSHTKGLIACAISQEAPIGIDVEYWQGRDFIALANYAFGPREREEVARDGISAFYRIWTLREAISKTTGVSLITTFDGDDYGADAPASGCWTTDMWQLFYTSPQIDYSLAIASKDDDIWLETSLIWVNYI